MFALELEFLKWLEGLRTNFLNDFFEGITLQDLLQDEKEKTAR